MKKILLVSLIGASSLIFANENNTFNFKTGLQLDIINKGMVKYTEDEIMNENIENEYILDSNEYSILSDIPNNYNLHLNYGDLKVNANYLNLEAGFKFQGNMFGKFPSGKEKIAPSYNSIVGSYIKYQKQINVTDLKLKLQYNNKRKDFENLIEFNALAKSNIKDYVLYNEFNIGMDVNTNKFGYISLANKLAIDINTHKITPEASFEYNDIKKEILFKLGANYSKNILGNNDFYAKLYYSPKILIRGNSVLDEQNMGLGVKYKGNFINNKINLEASANIIDRFSIKGSLNLFTNTLHAKLAYTEKYKDTFVIRPSIEVNNLFENVRVKKGDIESVNDSINTFYVIPDLEIEYEPFKQMKLITKAGIPFGVVSSSDSKFFVGAKIKAELEFNW